MSEIKQVPPVKYPEIEVPGHGKFVVKFGLGATYTLEEEMGLDWTAFTRKMQEMFPGKDASGEIIAGRTSQSFLLKVLSACIWDQAHLTPKELAHAFDSLECMQDIAGAVLEAFAKMPRSNRLKLQESSAVIVEQNPAPLN